MKIAFAHPALSKRLLLDGQMEVCGSCNGLGRAFRQDLDENRLVESMEADGDEDGLADYRGGRFDETCRTCKGRNVTQEIDWNAFRVSHPQEYKKVQAYEAGADEHRADVAAEARYFGY